MKILVTGGAGFIGSYLVDKLIKKNYEVIVIDKVAYENSKSRFIKINILNLNEVLEGIKEVDVVYHLAGLTLEAARKNAYEAVLLETQGVMNVLEACRKNDINKIAYASSFYVYDGIDEKMIVNEETPLNIFNMEFFGAAKLMGERIIKEYNEKYGIKFLIFRIGPTYGVGNCTSLIRTFIEAGLQNEVLEVYGEGRRKNQYTYVEDVVDGMISALNKNNEIYNLISPEEITIKELVKLLNKKFGFKYVFNTTVKEGRSTPYISPRKAMKELNWEPISLEKGIEITYEGFKRLLKLG